MMSNYYLGTAPADILGSTPRYFYGLRKNENGSIFVVKSDQIKEGDSIEINEPGEPSGNYNDFEPGVDFFEGITVNHQRVFENLKYPQYRWDNRSVNYYINANGELVARINQGFTYDENSSED
jgi:hypothetical protein